MRQEAEAVEAIVMVAGAPEAFVRCEELFGAISDKLYRRDEQPGQGSKVKMINQLLAGVHIAECLPAAVNGYRAPDVHAGVGCRPWW